MNDLFWLTLLVIFFATIGGAILRRLSKDKCLRLLNDHHVTYLAEGGTPLWGDLIVSSQGMELAYDAAYVTARGLVKTSYLVFPDEWKSAIALCRTSSSLTETERKAREAQIRASFRPGLLRRLLRASRNFFNMIRDAVTKAFSLFVGRMAAAGTVGQAVGSRGKEVDSLGEQLVGTIANAYEPLLERHIGRPVVVRIQNAKAATEPFSEFPGYLVDYSEDFLAVFNVEHTPDETFELVLSEPHAAADLSVDFPDGHVRIAATGDSAIIVQSLETGGAELDLGVTLLPGCSLTLNRTGDAPATLRAVRTKRIDLVCPRSRARIRFGSDESHLQRPAWTGAAPESEDPE